MSDDFARNTSILMICCICSANAWMFDIFDIDHLIDNLDIQLFDMLISQLKVIFSDIFVLLLRFWKLKSSMRVCFLIDFRSLMII